MAEQLVAIERLVGFEELDKAVVVIEQDPYNRAFRIRASVVGHPADLLIAIDKIQAHLEIMKRQVAGGRV